MKSLSTFLLFLLINISGQAQKWSPETSSAIQKYYFIPIEFDHLEKWIHDIQNDSSLIIKKNIFNQTGDSIFLNMVISKPSDTNPIPGSEHTIRILAKTSSFNSLSLENKSPDSAFIKSQPYRQVTTVQIVSSFLFDTSLPQMNTVKSKDVLATLFNEYKQVFASNKRFKKINKTLLDNTDEKMVIKEEIRFMKKNEVYSRFTIRRIEGKTKQEIQLILLYHLNHT